MPGKLLGALVLLVTCLGPCRALKCYICHFEEACNDPIDWTNMDFFLCEYVQLDKMPPFTLTDDGEESNGTRSPMARRVVGSTEPACMKVVVRAGDDQANNKTLTVRMCAPKSYAGLNICKLPQIAVGKMYSSKIVFCNACAWDFCNISSEVTPQSILTLVFLSCCLQSVK